MKQPHKRPVILVHGAGGRANIFRMPPRTSIVDYLIESGFDVWLENWRASIDLPPNQWTLDQAALYDHPEAVKTVVRETGCDSVDAIVHGQGSTSFMMSVVVGLVPEVRTIIANGVTLHPMVPRPSEIKLRIALPILRRYAAYLDPQWGVSPRRLASRVIRQYVQLTRRECHNVACRIASFTSGTGRQTLWRHDNLDEETHSRLGEELGYLPVSYFEQMLQCVRRGRLISIDPKNDLPEDLIGQPPKTDARIAFFAGELNRAFLAAGQERTFNFFDSIRGNYHVLYVVPQYAHLDIFIGKNAFRDVFPLVVTELERSV